LSPAGGRLRIGTRGSALALWQTERVRSLLAAAGYDSEPVKIKTTGDLTPDVPLARIGSRALFTKQIDDALLNREIDLAVHSLKDLPTRLPAGIVIGAVGEREDARDALVSRDLLDWGALPHGARVGTSSLRRRAQLLYHRPDLQVVDLRGNVDTRLGKLDRNPEWSAIVLASAGLVRLGLDHRIGERLPPDLLVPAPAQGALAVTAREEDQVVQNAVRHAVHDPIAELFVTAERAFLSRLEGGCQVPIAAYAQRAEGQADAIHLHGRVVSPDGRVMVEKHGTGPVSDPEESAALGIALADDLLAQGAGAILMDVRNGIPAISEP
jgi:hydroxymethylbilane synthase